MYIAKELPLPRANRNLLFNPSELYSGEIDVLKTDNGISVKTKKTLCITRKHGVKKMIEQGGYQNAK